MADEKVPTNPLLELVRSLQPMQSAMTPVEVTGGEMLTGDVTLADGTKLRLRVIVSQVSRVIGMAGPGGRPLYSVETAVVPTVLEWNKWSHVAAEFLKPRSGVAETPAFSVPSAPDSGDLAGQHDDVAERLDSFLRLRDGWDGHSAPRPSERAIARALTFVPWLERLQLDCQIEIAPFLDGGVAISIEHNSGRWLDLMVENDRTVSAERSDEAGGRVSMTDLQRDLDRHLRWLLQA